MYIILDPSRYFMNSVDMDDTQAIIQGETSRTQGPHKCAYIQTSCDDLIDPSQLLVEPGVEVTQTLVVYLLDVVQCTQTL